MRDLCTLFLLCIIGYATQLRADAAASPESEPDPCTVGIYSAQIPPERRPPLNVDAYFLPLVRLGSIVHPTESGVVPDETGHVPILGLSDTLRESWYIAKDAFPGSVPIEAELADGALSQRTLLGYGWSASAPGLVRFNPAPFRRLDALPQYQDLDLVPPLEERALPQRPAFAFPRYLQRLDRCSVLSEGYEDALENEYVRIDFNRIWGNAIGKMTWRHGARTIQIIVDDDIGALAQSTLWHATTADPPGTCCFVNPTEAGGVDLWNYSNTTRWAGSPVLSVTRSADGAPPSLTTVVRPMNFLHTPFDGTDGATPLLWRGTFTKRVSLYGPYAEILFRAQPDVLPDGDPIWNMNTVFWLRANAWGDPERVVYEIYDPSTGSRIRPDLPAYGTHVSTPLLPSYSAIIRTPDGAFAIGVIRGPNATPGLEYRLTRWCADRVVDGACPAARSILILDIHAFHAFALERSEEETVYITSGSTDIVEDRLRYACHVLGLGCPILSGK